MGSFRSPTARLARDAVTLTAAHRPDGVDPADWLDADDTITYWRVLPHSAVADMVTAAMVAVPATGRRGKAQVVPADAGAVMRARLRVGIVDWDVHDEDGRPVPWDPDRAIQLLDGLPEAVVAHLQRQIGNGDPEPPLSAVDPATATVGPDGAPEGPSVGETSAGS